MMVKPKMVPKKSSIKDVESDKQGNEGNRNKIPDETHTTESFVRPPEPSEHKIKKPPIEKSLLAQMTGKPKMVPKKPCGKYKENIEDIDEKKQAFNLFQQGISVGESIPQLGQNATTKRENEVSAVEFSAKEAEAEDENLKHDDIMEKHKKSPKKSVRSQVDGDTDREGKIIDDAYDPDVDSSIVSDADDSDKKKKKRKTRRSLNSEYEEFYNLKEKFLERLAVEGEDEIDPSQLSISELCFYSHEYIDKLKPQVDDLLEKKKKKEKARAIKGEQEEDKDTEKENRVIIKEVEVEKPVEKEPEPSRPIVTFDEEGNFQVDLDSLEFETAESLAEKRALENQTVLYDSRNTEYNRFGKRKKRKRTVFSPKDTAKFYTALSLIGPNFDKMTQFFPQFTRDDLHNKFRSEDKKNPDFITSLLKNVKFDVDIYGELLDSTDEEENEEGNEKKKDGKKEKKKEPKPEKIKRQKVENEEQKNPKKARKTKLDGETTAKKKEKAVKPKGFADYEPSGRVKKETQKRKPAKKTARSISRLSIGDNDENTLHGCNVSVDLDAVTDVEIDLGAATDIEIDTTIVDQLMKKRDNFEHKTQEEGQNWMVESGSDFVMEKENQGINSDSDQEQMPRIADGQHFAIMKHDLIREIVTENTESLCQNSSSAVVINEVVHCAELQEMMQEYSEAYTGGIDVEQPTYADGDEELSQYEENLYKESNANSYDGGDNSLEPQEILPHDVRVKVEELIVPDRKVIIRIKPTGPISNTPVVPKLITPPVGFVPGGSVSSLNPSPISSNTPVNMPIDTKLSEYSTEDGMVKDACVENERALPSGGKEAEHKAPKFKSGLLKSVTTKPVGVKRKGVNPASVVEGVKGKGNQSPSPEGSEPISSADQEAPVKPIDTKLAKDSSEDGMVKDACVDNERAVPSGGKEAEHKAPKFKSGLLKSITTKPVGVKKEGLNPGCVAEGLSGKGNLSPSPERSKPTVSAVQEAPVKPTIKTNNDSKVTPKFAQSGMLRSLTSKPLGLKKKIERPSPSRSSSLKPTETSSSADPSPSQASLPNSALKCEESTSSSSSPAVDKEAVKNEVVPLMDAVSVGTIEEASPDKESLKPRITQRMAGSHKPVTTVRTGSQLLKRLSLKPVVKGIASEKANATTNETPVSASVIENFVSKVEIDGASLGELCPRKRNRSSSSLDECEKGYVANSLKCESLIISSTSTNEKKPKLGSPVKPSLQRPDAVALRTARPAVKRASRIQKFEDSESSDSEYESSFIAQPAVESALSEQANSESNSSEPQGRERAIVTSAAADSNSSSSLLTMSTQRQSCEQPQNGAKRKLLSFKDVLKKTPKPDDSVKGVGQPSSESSPESTLAVQPWSSPLSNLEPTKVATSVLPPESLIELANVPTGSLVLVEVPNPINPSEKVIQVFQKFD